MKTSICPKCQGVTESAQLGQTPANDVYPQCGEALLRSDGSDPMNSEDTELRQRELCMADSGGTIDTLDSATLSKPFDWSRPSEKQTVSDDQIGTID